MADGGSHFDCNEFRNYCASIGTKLHIVAAYTPWLNGLLERSNGILLNVLKRLCAPGLREDDYESMAKKDIPSSWPDHLDTAIKNLSDWILPSLKFSPNELLLGLPLNMGHTDSPEDIELPTEEEIAVHMALVEQRHLDGYAATVDHAAKRKSEFDKKLLQRAPRNVVFQPGDLVQVHATEWVHTFTSIKKLVPMWSIPRRVASRLRNSYTLESLDGVLLPGLYNARRLRAFEPRDGTRLASEEMARLEEHTGDDGVNELEDDDSVTQ